MATKISLLLLLSVLCQVSCLSCPGASDWAAHLNTIAYGESQQSASTSYQNNARRLQQVNLVQLSPRRNPLRGFIKYQSGLVLHSSEYWAATLWESWAFLAAAGLWVVASFIFIVVRCVCVAKGEGFLPSGRTRTGADRTLLLLCCALLVVQLAALATFFVYGVLAYNAGRDLSKQLESSHPEVKQQLVSMTDSANTLQSVVNGTRLIAGRSMSSTFEPSPPDLATPSQTLLDDLEKVKYVTSGNVENLERVYEAVLAFVGVTAFTTLLFVLLAGGGAAQKNQKLMHGGLLLLPVSSILLWLSGGLVYGALLNSTDVCNGLANFLSRPAQQPSSQIRVDLLPCHAAKVSLELRQSTTQALFNMTIAVNTIIEDQFQLPEMAAFDNPPLLCQPYIVDTSGNFTQVSCPWPTSEHIFTHTNWEHNAASMRCAGNNNTLCALSSTPLIQHTWTTTVQMLEQIQTAESLLEETSHVESCDFASNSALDIWTETCERDQLRTPLLGAWVTCTIAAACALGLGPLLLIVMQVSAPHGISQVNVVYNPGFATALPLKSTAAGYSTAHTEFVSMNTMGNMSTMGTASNATFAFQNASTMSSGDLLSPPYTAGLDGFLTIPNDFLNSNTSPPVSSRGLDEEGHPPIGTSRA